MHRKQCGFTLIELLTTAAIILTIAMGLFRGTLADKHLAVHALEDQGFENIEITDKAWFFVGLRGCDGHDAARFTAQATNVRGKTVETYVCTGWPFKGATIRSK